MQLLNLKFIPFRYKVIFTLTFIIIFISLISFQFLKKNLIKEFEKNSEENVRSVISVLNESYLYQMQENNRKVLFPVLKAVSQQHIISNAYVLNAEKQLVFSTSNEDPGNINFVDEPTQDILISKSVFNNAYSMRAIMKIKNKSDCYKCHTDEKEILGYTIVDVPLHEIRDNLTLFENFSYIYIFVLIFCILLGISFLHFKTIKKSLAEFQRTISIIEDGNQKQRINLDPKAELGNLARSFNNMLDRLEATQSELELYHKHELLNAKKLATIGEMAASVAHEIKNPLAGISNAVEILCEEIKSNDNKPIFKEVRRQINRVNKTLSDLLQFSRPVALELHTGNINNIVNLVVSFLKSQVSRNSVVFNLILSKNLPEFKFDHLQIENCLINLGMNAIAAIKNQGEIVISTNYTNKNIVIIKIADNGIGIPSAEKEKIFKPFYTTKHKGTGLGLSIVEDIVKRHNGEITVNDNAGGGTIFTISIPIFK